MFLFQNKSQTKYETLLSQNHNGILHRNEWYGKYDTTFTFTHIDAVTMESCHNCGNLFIKSTKGYSRKRISTITSPLTYKQVFAASPSVSCFLCYSCIQQLNSKTVQWKGKRKWSARHSPSKSPPQSPVRKSLRIQSSSGLMGSSGQVGDAVRMLARKQYLKAFRLLLQHPATKQQMITACKEAILTERKNLNGDKSSPLRKPVTLDNVTAFSWQETLTWAEGHAPLLMAVLKAMFPKSEDKETVERRTGLILSVALYSNKRVRFPQACMGVQLWKQGCPQKVFATLNSLGVSQSVQAARSQVDRLRLGHDSEVKVWKQEAEKTAVGARRRLSFEEAPPRAKGYSLTWDNVQIDAHAKHHSTEHQNTFLMWALCFAHQNKVPFPLADTPGTLRAVEVDPHSILPAPEVFTSVRSRMVTVVSRILVDNIPPFECLKGKVNRHIPHQHSREMKEKSNVVNLGVVEANPSSTEGVIQVMETLHNHVPAPQGKLLPILCCGDGLSIERMVHSKRARSNGETPRTRLEGLVEGPQEFHREILLLQDTMDELFDHKSEACRGTLSQLKAYFSHRSLKKNVQDNVQHVWDMIEFATCAYICLLAVDICNMGNLQDTPADFPTSSTNATKLKWVTNLSQKIVDFCWQPPEAEDIMLAATASQADRDDTEEIFPYCSCMEDKDETMVKCCSAVCKQSWYHLSCAELQAAPHDDWYCSQSCADDGTYIYCMCHQRKGGEMVQCHLGDKCLHDEWYHSDCLCGTDFEDQWYCSDDCLQGAMSEDKVQCYSKALMWEGLCHLVRRDCVREGDGPAMIQTWQMDMVSFWNKRHYKYFIIGHQMLTGIGGFLPERLRHDLTWNRVANLKGGPGSNIGLDLVNEFLNNDFKDMLKHSRGQYTDTQVQRCAEMSGPFGRELDRVFTAAGLGSYITHASTFSHDGRYQADIDRFVSDFKGDGLFAYLPGRQHTGFEDYTYNSRIRQPEKMGGKLRQLAKEMDLWADIAKSSGQ
ncbi:uncharacterized protein LOC118423433 [Branchiostoma floridae]|uniref:Uncharacterized protein LOC118423433 n=1 Tax=Branchiostoma floridae TaxID=7739 RepID=A0A9J7LSM2_BRAFL|nr:uncharacterized protein LOC118423433 [Branchiostoma floridae]